MSKHEQNSAKEKEAAVAAAAAQVAAPQTRETTIEKIVAAGAKGEIVDLDQIKLKVLILCKTRNALESSAQFLDRRGWKTVVATDIKEIFKIITAFNPDIFLMSVNYPNEKVSKLPAIIFSSFKIHVVTFGEMSDTKTLKLMQSLPANFKMPGSVSGPNIQRRLKQILQELYSPVNPHASDANNDNKQREDNVKISGAESAKSKDGLKFFSSDKNNQSGPGYFPQNEGADSKEKTQGRNSWENKGSLSAGELSLSEEDEKLSSKFQNKKGDELINDLMNEFSDDSQGNLSSSENDRDETNLNRSTESSDNEPNPFAANSSKRKRTGSFKDTDNDDDNDNDESALGPGHSKKRGARENNTNNNNGLNTDEILEAVAEVSEKSSFSDNDKTGTSSEDNEDAIAADFGEKDNATEYNKNIQASEGVGEFTGKSAVTKDSKAASLTQSGIEAGVIDESDEEKSFDIDKHTSHLNVTKEKEKKSNKKDEIVVESDGSVHYDGKITIERILREAANAATEKKTDRTIQLLHASESLVVPIKFEGKSGIVLIVQEGQPFDRVTFENKFMHFLMKMHGKMGLEIGNTQRLMFETAEVKESPDQTIINFKTRNLSGEVFITHSPLTDFQAQIKPANYGKAEIAIADVVEEIKIGADLYLHLPQNEKFYKVVNKNGWISHLQKNRLVKSNVAVFINTDDLESYKESQKTARAINNVKSQWPKAKKVV